MIKHVSPISPDERRELAKILDGFVDRIGSISVFIKSMKKDNELENLVHLTAEMTDNVHNDLDVCREQLLLKVMPLLDVYREMKLLRAETQRPDGGPRYLVS